MNIGIHNITPSDELNHLLWEWTLDRASTRAVRNLINILIFTRQVHPDTDAEVIFKVTRDTYGDRVTRN